MILDIVTVLATVTRDCAAVRALPHHMIRNSYCKMVEILWEKMIVPLLYPSNACLDPADL